MTGLNVSEQLQALTARVEALEKKPPCSWINRYWAAIEELRAADDALRAVRGSAIRDVTVEASRRRDAAWDAANEVWAKAATDFLFMFRHARKLFPADVLDGLRDAGVDIK